MEQKLIRRIFRVNGMTCASCEMRIENAVKKLDGIIEVKAVLSKSCVYVTYYANVLLPENIIKAIEKLDYTVEDGEGENNDKPAVKKNSVNQLIGIGIIILAIYLIINNTIGFNFIPEVNQSMGYGILFVVGLLTSVHCVAMCGGINLSQCVSYKYDNTKPGKLAKVKPSFLYNSGRVVSYTMLGGIVGVLGSAVSFSGAAKGIVAIISGIFMVIMGLNMLNIFPWLRKLNPRMPKIFGRKIHSNKGKYGPFVVGMLNGLMPCGPLQSMQLYALGTGSFFAGALSMFMFSLGTVPLMFVFGLISSLLSSKFTHKMLKASAILVIVLGVVMANRGLALSGINITFAAPKANGSSNIAVIEGDVQTVTTRLESGRYTPIIVQKGIPVKWTIKVEKGDLNGCNNPITIPQFNYQKKLEIGDNIIEFTPEEEGNITYTCWMGMIRSNISVVTDLSKLTEDDIKGTDNGNISPTVSIPADKAAVAVLIDEKQTVSIDVTGNAFDPAIVVVQRGTSARWIFNVRELNEHNSAVIFIEYNAGMYLEEGENEIEFTPEDDFTFTCITGTMYGYVKVVDDINNIDIEKIKSEVAALKVPVYDFSSGGVSCH